MAHPLASTVLVMVLARLQAEGRELSSLTPEERQKYIEDAVDELKIVINVLEQNDVPTR